MTLIGKSFDRGMRIDSPLTTSPDNRTTMLSYPTKPAIFAGFVAIAFPGSFTDTAGHNFRAVFRLPLRFTDREV